MPRISQVLYFRFRFHKHLLRAYSVPDASICADFLLIPAAQTGEATFAEVHMAVE